MKRTCDFDFRPLAADLQHARFVCLNIPDPDLAHYAMLFLYSHGIAFRQQRPAAEGHIPRAAPGEWLLTCEPEPGRTGRRSVVAIPPGMQ